MRLLSIEHRTTADIKDPEVAAMHALADSLTKLRRLTAEERERVLAWMSKKFDITVSTGGMDRLDQAGRGQYL